MATPVKTLNVIDPARDGSKCYALCYNPATRKVLALKYGGMGAQVYAPLVLFSADTYAAIQAEAASLGLTGLPAQVAGQP